MNRAIEGKKIKLAIETAIGGGSLSLLENGSVIDRWHGEREISRSEELVEAISLILKRNSLNVRELETIAVSRGPGSYTGVRIGLATAIGLSNGLNIRKFGVSLIESLYHKFYTRHQVVITAFSFGRNEVCYQIFNILEMQDASDIEMSELVIKIAPIDEFIVYFSRATEKKFIVDEKLYAVFENCGFSNFANLTNAGLYLSDIVGQSSENNIFFDSLTPIYPRDL